MELFYKRNCSYSLIGSKHSVYIRKMSLFESEWEHIYIWPVRLMDKPERF